MSDAWLREALADVEPEDDADAERYPCRPEPHAPHWSDTDGLWCPGYQQEVTR